MTRSGPACALGRPPDHVELALERLLVVGKRPARAHEELSDPGRVQLRRRSRLRRLHRNIPPADHLLPLVGHRGGEQLLELRTAPSLAWQEAHHDAVASLRRQVELTREERMRKLHEDARPVSGLGVGARGSAMLEALERGERTFDHLVLGAGAEACDEGDAAGVVLALRVVKALRLHSRSLPLF